MPALKIASIIFRFPPHVKNSLLVISDQQGRTMVNMLERLTTQYCESEGVDWSPKDLTVRKTRPAQRPCSHLAKNAEHEQEVARVKGAASDV